MTQRAFEKGDQFGWLTLIRERISPTPTRGSTGRFWTSRCRCEMIHVVSRESLLSGRVRSCRACAKQYRAEERKALEAST